MHLKKNESLNRVNKNDKFMLGLLIGDMHDVPHDMAINTWL